jgi:hypothetical protein
MRDNSIKTMLLYVKKALQWPFLTLYSCYWASTLLYEPYYANNFPNIMGALDEDETYWDITMWEELGYNILFNLGYMILDLKWLILVEITETDYWYRNGFVAGDIYMRFFFRTLAGIPV